MNAHRNQAFLTYSCSYCRHMTNEQRVNIIPQYFRGKTDLRQMAREVSNVSTPYRGNRFTTELYSALECMPRHGQTSNYPILTCVCLNCPGMDYWTREVIFEALKRDSPSESQPRELMVLSRPSANLNLFRGQQLFPTEQRANMLNL